MFLESTVCRWYNIFIEKPMKHSRNADLQLEVLYMAISYKKLWKLLIDRDMKKKDLQELAGVSAASITKLGKNENVNTEIISKICVALKCDVGDIMEIILEPGNK